jgi:hypothetical protein
MAKFYIQPKALQQQGGGGGLKDLGVLMGLLGLGPEQDEQERLNKAQQTQQAYYEGMIGQQQAAGRRSQEELDIRRGELTAAAEERKAAAQERIAAEKFRQEQLIREAQAKESEEEYKNFVQIMASPDYTPAEKRRIASKRSPGAAAVEAEMKKERVGEFTKGLEDVYKKGPKQIATYLKNQEAIPGMKEVMQDPGIRWAELNAGMPAAQPGFLSRLLGGGSERERAVATAAKVAPVPAGEASVSPSTVVPNVPMGGAVPRPMAFTGYEPAVEGPIRGGYGAVPGGAAGTPPLDILMNVLASREIPSRPGYYTPRTPVEVPPAAFESMAGGPSAMPPGVQPQVPLNDLLSKLMTPGTSAMAPY